MNQLFELKFGSHLYGCDTPNSDLDLKGIYIPEAREIVLGNYKKNISTSRPKKHLERNTKDDVDIEIFSLDRYLKLLSEGQTVSLDILFSPDNMFIQKGPNFYIFEEIRKNKDRLLCKDLAAFIGYAKQQAAKYGLKGFRVAALRETLDFLNRYNGHEIVRELRELCNFVYNIGEYGEPLGLKNEYISLIDLNDKNGNNVEYLKICDKFYQTNSKVKYIKDQIQKRFDEYGQRALKAELNEGIDWKSLSHAVRVNNQGIELLNTGKITFPRPDRQLLLDIKLGKMDYNKVADIIVEGLEILKGSEANSSLRSKPDQDWIDNFIYEVYSKEVKK